MAHPVSDPLLFPSIVAAPAIAAIQPDFSFENQMRSRGFERIAGTDEAGRGPLAGPVVAAAVVFPSTLSDAARQALSGLTDSKKLTDAKRAALFDHIMAHASATAIVSLSASHIDDSDILSASLSAMRMAVLALSTPVDAVLVDGNKLIRQLPQPIVQQAIIKGDSRSLSIAAASILAKVSRDRMMDQLDAQWPGYGLADHKGYGSPAHRAAIQSLGGVPRVHRYSFRPLRKDDVLI